MVVKPKVATGLCHCHWLRGPKTRESPARDQLSIACLGAFPPLPHQLAEAVTQPFVRFLKDGGRVGQPVVARPALNESIDLLYETGEWLVPHLPHCVVQCGSTP